MKFVMTQSICPEGIEKLKADTNGQVEIIAEDNPDPNNYLDDMKDADALIVRIGKCDAAVLACCPQLKVIGRPGIGYDSVDVTLATKLGIPVVVTPGAYGRSVAEHTVAMMLSLSKNLVEANNETLQGHWSIRDAHKAFQWEGKTVGIIGLGPIGRETAKICLGIGMKVIGYDPYLTQDKIGDLCELKATAKEVWEQADFVSVHLPVVPSTEHSIGREQFSWMKPTASFINCARGALIKENELVECLKDGTLFQAGLDVFEHEPIQESSRELFDLDNVIMTPHMAATTEQSVLNCCTSVANDIVAVCNGQEPKVKAQKPKF